MENKEAIESLKWKVEYAKEIGEHHIDGVYVDALDLAVKALEAQRWIPVTERLPVNTNPVNITWVNHQPESYYADIKDKPFTATGCFCDGKWYWYSSTCQDYLIYYRDCPFNAIDEGIEVLAWMPLPEPYTKEETT